MDPNMIPLRPDHVYDPVFAAGYEKAVRLFARPESSYTLIYEPHLIHNTNPIPTPPSPKQKRNTIPNPIANKQKDDATKPRKAAPKIGRTKLLSNVKTLTITGMLDGVDVKYVNKTQKIEIPGRINGAFYLCGCKLCNYSNSINAYEFESHAGIKTSHPNNHIHFETGKSMHMVVMELNNTRESDLFDALQTLTAAYVDYDSFLAWKESL